MINQKNALFNILYASHGSAYLSQRVRPKLWEPYYLIHRMIKNVVSLYLNSSRTKISILDIGGGECPFKELVTEGQNYCEVGSIVDLEQLWHKEEHDIVLCLDVMEHIFNINKFKDQLASSVKNGGTLILSVPFAYPIHGWDYNDYWRFTDQALVKFFPGFSVSTLKKSNTFLSTPLLKLNHLIHLVPIPYVVKRFIYLPINLISLFIDACAARLVPEGTVYRKMLYSDPLEYILVLKKDQYDK